MPKGTCSVEGCEREHYGRGLCRKHYQRWLKHGDVLGGNPFRWKGLSTSERFWAKVDKNGPVPAHRPELGPCWVWTAHLLSGYGRFWTGDQHVQAHRWAYIAEHGPFPAGLEPDHLCRNRACVKTRADQHGPSHIEPVTHRENVLRGTAPTATNARKTHCPRGHPLEGANLYRYRDGRRECRECRECRRLRHRKG